MAVWVVFGKKTTLSRAFLRYSRLRRLRGARRRLFCFVGRPTDVRSSHRLHRQTISKRRSGRLTLAEVEEARSLARRL